LISGLYSKFFALADRMEVEGPMKIQDIVFLIAFLAVVWGRSKRLPVLIGISLLILAIPLFATWTFFTAERFTWYAAAFFLLAIVFHLVNKVHK